MLPFNLLLLLPNIWGYIKEGIKFAIVNWKATLIVLMISTIAYQNFATTQFVFGLDTLPSLRAQVTECQDHLKGAADANKLLSDTIDDRNDEISQWKDASDKLVKQNEKLAKELAERRKKAQTDANKVLSGPTPKTCQDAMQYLRDARKDLQW